MYAKMNNAFEFLYSDDSFTSSLGRLVLSASRFETILKRYIQTQDNDPKMDKMPMGRLLKKLRSSHYLGSTVDYHLSLILHERNYFVHQLYDKLAGYSWKKRKSSSFAIESKVYRMNWIFLPVCLRKLYKIKVL